MICADHEGFYITAEGQKFKQENMKCKAVYCSHAKNKTNPKPTIDCIKYECPDVYLDLRRRTQ